MIEKLPIDSGLHACPMKNCEYMQKGDLGNYVMTHVFWHLSSNNVSSKYSKNIIKELNIIFVKHFGEHIVEAE